MIARLRGAVIDVRADSVILDVAGVGYKVRAGAPVLAQAHERRGEELSVYTYLAVREDALELYGFETSEELSLFELLIGVSGIGPKSALSIMNLGDTEGLRSAIANGDIAYLTRVSGIGRKTAEKIVLELREKAGGMESSADGGSVTGADADVIDALTSLGYTLRQAREALKSVPKEITGTSDKLREALRILGTA